jgi:cytochrome c oxidase subunit 2
MTRIFSVFSQFLVLSLFGASMALANPAPVTDAAAKDAAKAVVEAAQAPVADATKADEKTPEAAPATPAEKPLSDDEKKALIAEADAIAAFNKDAVVGAPTDWQIYYQPASSPVMTKLEWLHDAVMVIITLITIFVTVLLGYICVRFSKRANPKPASFTHNKLVEVIWTVIPILILVGIAIPSLRVHYQYTNNQTIIDNPDLTVKVVGRQWYWSYEYPDHGIAFDSNIKADKDLAEGEPRLLAVDNPIVVPVNKTVRIQITGADVMHAWAVPAFGVKQGAVPGRLNETWFKAEKEGIYYGQCSILCGKAHGFMPIEIRVVSDEQFAAWAKGAKVKFN